jgi:amino acid transporter
MALEVFVLTMALVVNTISVVTGLVVIALIWRSRKPQRLQRISLVIAMAAIAFAGFSNSFWTLMRIRGDP